MLLDILLSHAHRLKKETINIIQILRARSQNCACEPIYMYLVQCNKILIKIFMQLLKIITIYYIKCDSHEK